MIVGVVVAAVREGRMQEFVVRFCLIMVVVVVVEVFQNDLGVA